MPRRPRPLTSLIATIALVATLPLLAACEDDEGTTDAETPTATAATETPTGAAPTETETTTATPTETPTETATAPAGDVERVEAEGVTFEVPAGWTGEENTWVSPEGDITLLFATREWEPPMEPESVLPEGAVTMSREDLGLAWGMGGLYTVHLVAEDTYERHAIVRVDDRIYDWWMAAETVEELEEHQRVLDSVLVSVELRDP